MTDLQCFGVMVFAALFAVGITALLDWLWGRAVKPWDEPDE